MEEKLKKCIIAVAVIIILVIIILVIMYIRGKLIGTDYNTDTEFEKDVSHMELNTEYQKVQNKNNYYAIKSIIGKYGYASIDGGQETLYNMLAPEYIQEENIPKDNVLEHVDRLMVDNLTENQLDNLQINVNISEMYYKDLNVNTSSYFVNGEFVYNVNSNRVEFSLLVNIDSNNSTFYIYPTEYIKERYPSLENLSTYSSEIDNIPENDYNIFDFVNIEDATIVTDYLYNYKDKIVNDLPASYDLIDEEYRKEKFPSIDEYEIYVKDHMQELLSISFSKYLVNKTNDYNEYICIDTQGNYYIFKETAVMQYTLLLDYYTVNTGYFIDKYDNSNAQEKVALNIEKIVQAMNLEDYGYVYNKLDETFRNNNWASEEEFEQYMKENFPLHYDVEYTTFREENSTYIQEIILSDITGESDETQTINIIMQLKDNYEFVMSFSIE